MSKSILSACVAHIKSTGLTGKLRDDAADHYMAGAKAALESSKAALADMDQLSPESAAEALPTLPAAKGYLSVLEAMAGAE